MKILCTEGERERWGVRIMWLELKVTDSLVVKVLGLKWRKKVGNG